LIGWHLINKLQDAGFEVAVLSRRKVNLPEVKSYVWDVEENEIEEGAQDNVKHIIHLAGANIGEKRWRKKRN